MDAKDVQLPIDLSHRPFCFTLPFEDLIVGSTTIDLPQAPASLKVLDRVILFGRRLQLVAFRFPREYNAILSLEVDAICETDGKSERTRLTLVHSGSASVRGSVYTVKDGSSWATSVHLRVHGTANPYSRTSTHNWTGHLEIDLLTPLGADTLQTDIVKATASDTHPGSVSVLLQGGQKMPACAWLMAARSPVFKAMFIGEMREAKEGSVHMDDLPVSAVRCFIHAVQSGTIPDDASMDDVCHLLVLADRYDVPSLKPLALDRTILFAHKDVGTVLAAGLKHELVDILALAAKYALQTGTPSCEAALVSTFVSTFRRSLECRSLESGASKT